MTVFKITRKKVTFGRAETPKEDYKRILRKNEEEDQRDLHRRRFLFGLIKDSPSRDHRIFQPA
jgi:hypothetical protein